MKSVKVLLADNHHAVRSALSVWLEEQPFIREVEEAIDLESLLIQIATGIPDILLLDWDLPGLKHSGGGYQLLETLQNMLPSLRVIVLSLRPEVKKLVLDARVDDFVSKFSQPDYLLDVFEKIIKPI